MIVLGLNAFHADAAAAIVVDGKLIAAVEEERFCRVKHYAGFPKEAVRYCLAEAGISLDQVDVIAINQDSSANLLQKGMYLATNRPELSLIADRLRNRSKRKGLGDYLKEAFPDAKHNYKVENVEHHIAHLASAFYASDFDRSVVVSVDGFGDFASAAWGLGEGTKIDVADRVFFPHSLGIFYQALTQYLGFPNYGDEYKVMGLAPYGKPLFLNEMREIVKLNDDGSFKLNLNFFRHHKEKIEYQWEDGIPHVGELYSDNLAKLLGPIRAKTDPLTQRHMDIARSIQAMYEEAAFHLFNRLHDRYKVDNIAIAGGCGANSVANGRVYKNTPFKHVYVQSAAGDAGGAVGAAFAVVVQNGGSREGLRQAHAYWGPSYDDAAVRECIDVNRARIDSEDCVVEHVTDEQRLCDLTAQAISEGKVIGWYQGRSEWGPRALGNRSILADVRRTDMKDILNLKIKRRESFRPFAPSILREKTADWFETEDEVPFMMQVYQIREECRQKIPAVTHVDGSGRLQTVYQSTNPRYYRLIQAFERLTGVPIVLNTSFNENEPVVNRPIEALDCFLRTKMDVLVLGDWFIARRQDAAK